MAFATLRVVFGLLLVSASASAQEGFLLPAKLEMAPQAGAQKARPGDREWHGELYLRYSAIGGSAALGDDWDDIFDDGIGFRGEVGYEYHINERWSIEWYISIGLDFFGGGSGSGVQLDDWLVLPWMVGGKGKVDLGKRWFAEAYLGIGFVEYTAVDASTSVGSIPFITDSLAFAFEIGARVGYKFNQKVGLIAGLGYERWGSPEASSEIKAAGFPSFDPVENITLDIGVWIKF